MATLTVQDIVLAGLETAFAAASSTGDEFANTDERVVFHVKNDDADALVVTVASSGDCNQGFTHDVVASIPTGLERVFGPFDKERFNDSTGMIQVTYDDETSVTVAAIRLPRAP